ncbi:MAG: RsmE family RNA methyltransferase [Candidatus Omnitrophica bacterium]|nr:RsmE family RNA methyltransferase [Candidatus Omnitrophota bacterium]
MNRFFIDKINPLDKYIILDDPVQVHHLKDVLRIKPQEEVAVFDSLGNEYFVLVAQLQPKAVKLELREKKQSEEPGVKITVACAIPKNVKMDDIVDKLTQLGVECIIPLETERVIVRLDKQKKLQRLRRWEKISLSALKQSQRSKFVAIKPVSKLGEVILAAHDFDLKLIPTLEGERKTLKGIFDDSAKKIKTVMVLIGPEGDFTPAEVALAKAAGFLPINLGRGVLRVDTAAIAVVSFIKLNEEH